MNEKLAIIPARGGSKRLPRKNIRPFAGLPVIGYAIAAARESALFDHIIVSTDDAEVAEVARQLGATTPFVRPSALSDDHTGTTAVVAHAARWALAQGWQVNALCCIYATAPFVSPLDLIAGWELLNREKRDYVFAAGRYSFPIQRAVRFSKAGELEALFPEHRLTRSQDLPPTFHDAGQFYWARTEVWLEERPIFAPASAFIELPPWRVQDIDSEDDWRMAEYLLQVQRQMEP